MVKDDFIIANDLLKDVFGNLNPSHQSEMKILLDCVRDICEKYFLVPDSLWLEKLLQIYTIYTIQDIHHGIMIVGASGSGKTSAWKVLFKALERMDKSSDIYYIIKPKSVKISLRFLGFNHKRVDRWNFYLNSKRDYR